MIWWFFYQKSKRKILHRKSVQIFGKANRNNLAFVEFRSKRSTIYYQSPYVLEGEREGRLGGGGQWAAVRKSSLDRIQGCFRPEADLAKQTLAHWNWVGEFYNVIKFQWSIITDVTHLWYYKFFNKVLKTPLLPNSLLKVWGWNVDHPNWVNMFDLNCCSRFL